jgi:hypothetical protein
MGFSLGWSVVSSNGIRIDCRTWMEKWGSERQHPDQGLTGIAAEITSKRAEAR